MADARDARREILIVEDDWGIRELLTQVLEDEGYHVSSVADGLEALQYLKSARELPTLIVLDFKMPVMDGAEFRMRQQEDVRLAQVPVIFLTADQKGLEDAARMGVTALAKPLKLDALLETVARYAR